MYICGVHYVVKNLRKAFQAEKAINVKAKGGETANHVACSGRYRW